MCIRDRYQRRVRGTSPRQPVCSQPSAWMKLTKKQTSTAQSVFEACALCDVMGPDELTRALEEIGGPEWSIWTGGASWVEEYDEIGCGELDIDAFLKLLADKDVFDSDGPPMDDLDELLEDSGPDDIDAILDEDDDLEEIGGLSKDQIESARDAFNDADEDLAAMIGPEGLHFALCTLNEKSFIAWSDSDCTECLEKYDDIGCGEIDFDTFLQICVDEGVFVEKPAAETVDVGALRKEIRLELQQAHQKEKDEQQAEHEAAITAAEAKWKTLMQARETDKTELTKAADAQEEVQTLKNQVKAISDQLADKHQQVAQLSAKAQETEVAHLAAVASLERNIEMEHAAALGKEEEIQRRMKEMQQDAERLVAELEAAQVAAAEKDAQIAALKASASSEGSEMQGKLAELNHMISERDDQLEKAGTRCEELEGSVASTKSKLAEAESKLSEATAQSEACLLYTSDAADEEDSVDLGGRRIIKKKNKTSREGI
eukprot:TRINITY_DN25164_c0_g2_i2.p1 TRINITY_DN25164_c0_g2~~TRINITY_DN25164_c0_g2_i2.p1  ORF type:complete len:488 (+),score=152.14 TRINITY_DN25164_c0_g2_i2:115-1578(+)